MHRFILSLSLVAVLLGFATSERASQAQDATPDPAAMLAMASHPVVGAWRWTIDLARIIHE